MGGRGSEREQAAVLRCSAVRSMTRVNSVSQRSARTIFRPLTWGNIVSKGGLHQKTHRF